MDKEFKTYRICIEGHLPDGWASYFNDSLISRRFDSANKPVTVIMVKIKDKSELYGIISKVRDLGLSLINLNQIKMRS
ncbi:MAG: hypothetical protein GY834_16045 [Bacteroidetes bacterium]|nr:hypothetical protein [Bacteroidota bacterium]